MQLRPTHEDGSPRHHEEGETHPQLVHPLEFQVA